MISWLKGAWGDDDVELPQAWYGDAENDGGDDTYTPEELADEDDDDDEELAVTPADVIAMLGFDPLLYKEDEDEGNG